MEEVNIYRSSRIQEIKIKYKDKRFYLLGTWLDNLDSGKSYCGSVGQFELTVILFHFVS